MTDDLIQPLKILLVEDSTQDIEITRRVFAKGRVRNDLIVVRDGEEALDYLYHRGRFQDHVTSPCPGLILLDLNLPKLGGIEVLQQIKQDGDLKTIPVIILTGSQQNKDNGSDYNIGVNTYIMQKPFEFESFMQVANAIHGCPILITRSQSFS